MLHLNTVDTVGLKCIIFLLLVVLMFVHLFIFFSRKEMGGGVIRE